MAFCLFILVSLICHWPTHPSSSWFLDWSSAVSESEWCVFFHYGACDLYLSALTTLEWSVFWSFYWHRLSQVFPSSLLSSPPPLLSFTHPTKTLAACQSIRPCTCVPMCSGMCEFIWDLWRTSGLLQTLKCIYTEELPITPLATCWFKAYCLWFWRPFYLGSNDNLLFNQTTSNILLNKLSIILNKLLYLQILLIS